MDWKNVAVGMANAAAQTLPALERQGIAEEELGMRKEVLGIQKTKFDEEKRISDNIKNIWKDALLETKTLTPQPGIGGAQTPTMGVTKTGSPNVDSGTGIELGQQPSTIPQPTPQTEPQTTLPQGEMSKGSTPARNSDLLGVRSRALMKTHDYLMSENRIEEASKIKKAELDNIFQIARLSPKTALQTWNNTPHLVQEYGEMDPASLKETGEYVQTVVGDNLITLNKHSGTHKIEKIEGLDSKPTANMYVEKPIGPNTQQKFQWNPKSKAHDIPFGEPYRIHKPEGGAGEKLTMSDVKSGYTMAMTDIKNRMMVDMTPEERQDFANMPSENLMAALLGGNGKSLPEDKKAAYTAEITQTTDYYGQLEKQVLGRKGVVQPKPVKGTGGAVGAGGRKSNVDYLKTYIKENGGKYSAQAMFDTLVTNGKYSKEAYLEAVRELKSGS